VTILDASVAVKWYFSETASDEAIDILNSENGALMAPDVFAVEVNAALVRKANMDKSQRDGVRLLLADFQERLAVQQVRLVRSTSQGIEKAAQLAIDLGHPLKDCLYLALAIELDCELVTADARFASKARDIWPKLRVLGE
jgi:predicted nucleic acid-binding protein